MKHFFLSAFLLFAMVACSQVSDSAKNKITDQEYLGMYYWDLTDARDKTEQRLEELFVREDRPIRIHFDKNRFAVENTCNRMGGTYTLLQDSTLSFGRMAATMMLCSNDKLNRLDQKVHSVLQGDFSYFLSVSEKPKLVLKKSDGETLHFSGVPTPETRYGSAGETIFLEVAAQTRACSHPLNPTKPCLQIREIYYDKSGIKTGNSGDFENLYQPIEGYTHTPGIRNVLRVKRFKVQNPAADASSIAYVLDLVVESEVVKP